MDELKTYPVAGRNEITLRDVRKTPLGLGDEEKHIVEGVVTSGEKARSVSLIERKADFPEDWINNWQMLRSASLPVPPTLRTTETGNLLVTNLKQNGMEMFGKGASFEIENASFRKDITELQPIQKVFLETYNQERAAIRSEVKRLVEIANQHLIILPPDDAFELLLSPAGTWSLVIVDLALVGRAKTQAEALKSNRVSSEKFLDDLENCRHFLELMSRPPLSAREHLNQQMKSLFAGKKPSE